MNSNLSQKQIGIAVAAVVVIAGLLWYFFGGSGGTAAPLTADSGPNPIETQFLTLTGELTAVSFNTQIFSDARFAALTDITIPTTAEPVGRTDPFAPTSASTGTTGQ